MNVLLISQHIFPMQTPRASRTIELAKEFARQGHRVVVYAVLGSYNYIEIENKYNIKIKGIPIKWQLKPITSDGYRNRHFLDKILSKVIGNPLEFPVVEFSSRIPDIIKGESKHDLLISIADPHPIHWGCANAKLKTPENFPSVWIADCGDPYMENGKKKKHSWFDKQEKLFCELCDAITVPVKSAVEQYYREFRQKITVIPQGFNFDLPIKQINVQNEITTFVYAGTFIEKIRDPKKLLEFLSNLTLPFKFIVYTSQTEVLEPFIKKLGSKLQINGLIPREELLTKIKTCDFLLNIENVDTPGQVPSKLIDFSIAGRPILSIHPNLFEKEIIEQFIQKDYTNQFHVQNIEQYQISNVVSNFINLYNKTKQQG